MKKRILSTLVLLCMALSLLPAAAAAPLGGSFTDVDQSAYYYTPVQWAVEKGLTSGTGPSSFSPNAPCTRGQIVTFLWNASGQPEPRRTGSAFVDVGSSDYFYKAVLWAAEEGIASGTDATHFTPDRACSRGEAVTFLWRWDGCASGTASYFNDVSRLSYYKSAVDWAVAKGITSGTGNDGFSPNGPCTRGQIVTFLYRVEHPVTVNSGTPAWCQAYMTFLRNYTGKNYWGKEGERFQLAYIDDNSIPEMVIGDSNEYSAHLSLPTVYAYHGGSVLEVGSYGQNGGFSYVPDQNIICSSYDAAFDAARTRAFIKIEGGREVTIADFDAFRKSEFDENSPIIYRINEQVVSRSSYISEHNKITAGKTFKSVDSGDGAAITSTNIAKIATNPNSLVTTGYTYTLDKPPIPGEWD